MYFWLILFYIFVDGNNESSARSGASPRHNWDMTFVYNSIFVSQPPRPQNIRKITAFFYWKGITLSLAIRLYQICNDKYASPVSNTRSNLYLKWQRNRFKPHMFHHYDIQHRRVLWINGSSLNQRETVQPEVTVMDFAIGGCYSQCPAEIRQKVLKLRGELSDSHGV